MGSIKKPAQTKEELINLLALHDPIVHTTLTSCKRAQKSRIETLETLVLALHEVAEDRKKRLIHLHAHSRPCNA